MTLVAGISVGGLPAFIGDLLISWRLPAPVDLPTQAEESVRPGLGGQHAAGLAQKLLIVRPYLLLCWAGNFDEMSRIVTELDRVLPRRPTKSSDFGMIFPILNTCAEGTELVALLNWDGGVHPFGVRTRGFELGERRIYLLGSGASDFFEYLESHPEVLPDQEIGEGNTARAIALRFAARAMLVQWKTGGGLKSSWGGGFEVAFPEPAGFRKVGDVLFRAWLVDVDGSYYGSDRSFFIRYYGHDLYLSCFNPGEKTYLVRSPIGEAISPPAYQRVQPQWTVDVFLMKETASFVEFARYNPLSRPAIDFVEFENGRVVGWTLDRHYVETCVATAIAQARDGDHFSITRF